MQGRLLPKYKDRYQAHPFGYWKKEFPIAADLGMDCIEFIFDYEDYELNPLWSKQGIREIQNVIQETGVQVFSVCADFFMECPLHSNKEQARKLSKSTLLRLLESCNRIGIKDLVIPCVDQSSLINADDLENFRIQLEHVIPSAENLGVNLSLETDLPPQPFKKLLEDFNSESVTVNYDTGNSVSMGYDFREELLSYGRGISDLHIKDRTLGGGSVFLGDGDVDFQAFFNEFRKFNFIGPVIMQLYRDDEGISIFQKQLNVLRSIVKEDS